MEISSDENHVRFLIQTTPILSVKELLRLHLEVKQQLWGGLFWSSGYYVNTVGQYANEETIKNYISAQGNDLIEYKESANFV